MEDCIFCKIDAGEISSGKLFEDKKCFIIKDIHPKAPMHFLVIPHQHIPTISDLHEGEDALAGHMIKLGKEIALSHGAQGYKLQFNVHEKGGQEVFHIHLHVLGWN